MYLRTSRGLVHPIIFGGRNNSNNNDGRGRGGDAGGTGGTGSTNELFQTFGAIRVSLHNFYRLMKTNQTAMLFPGGVREVFHSWGKGRHLF